MERGRHRGRGLFLSGTASVCAGAQQPQAKSWHLAHSCTCTPGLDYRRSWSSSTLSLLAILTRSEAILDPGTIHGPHHRVIHY